MGWEGIDKRKFPRVRYKCLIKVSQEETGKALEAYTHNLGSGGICVILDQNLGLFQKVNIELFLEEGKNPISCEGVIVWIVRRHPTTSAEIESFDTGVEFTGLIQRDKDRISNLINNILGTES